MENLFLHLTQGPWRTLAIQETGLGATAIGPA